jgi:hypothetical protein
MLPTMRTLNICFVLSLLVLFMPVAQAQEPSSAGSHDVGLPIGVTLPQSGAIFAIDHKGAQPEIVQLHAAESVSNSHAAGNFARSMVYVGGHASIDLQGLNSSTHLADAQATFYIRANTDDPELMRQRVHLILLEQAKDRRVAVKYSQNIFGGQRKKKYHDIAITKTSVQGNAWLKITPQKPLAPGEYGIAFMSSDPAFVPDAIYDFDVATGAAVPEKQ